MEFEGRRRGETAADSNTSAAQRKKKPIIIMHVRAQTLSSLPHQASAMNMHACTGDYSQVEGCIDIPVSQISLFSVESGSQLNEPG